MNDIERQKALREVRDLKKQQELQKAKLKDIQDRIAKTREILKEI